MTIVRCIALTTGVVVLFAQSVLGQQDVQYEERDGVRYRVTRQVVKRQVPVTVMQDRQQTSYVQKLQTNTINHQQCYSVPITQYQWVSRMHGRFNPFITPYWTHNLKPVTRWQQQVANVQIPVNQMSWVPQTRTVQVPVTEYRLAEEEIISRVAVSQPRTLSQAQPLSTNRPAMIAVRPSRSNAGSIGGVALENDPPQQATGWRSPNNGRYR